MAFREERQAVVEKAGINYREDRWLIANYEADDVVLHCPYSVRASCSNEDLRREK
jgi:hypothetical protein